MKKKIDVAVILLIIMLVMALALLVLLWGVFNSARQHDRDKTELIALSHNVLDDDNRLIWLIHRYTITHDTRYLDEYIALLNNPETFSNRLNRMQEIGLTEAETDIIGSITEIWAELEKIETGVIDIIGAGDYQQAIGIVFGNEYEQADRHLINTIYSLIGSIEARSADTTLRLNRLLQIVMLIFSLAYITLITALYIVFRNNSRLREQEREANEAKSRFLAMMSHEIRTPMNAILGVAEMHMQDESITADTEDALSRIYESGNLLLNIINDILDLTKIEAGKLEINPIKYDVPSLINDTIQLNRLRFQSKLIDFRLTIDENTPLNLYGDELRIRQILGNILSNAYKYTGAGKVEMHVSAEPVNGQSAHKSGIHDASSDHVMLIITVSDTGQGMSKEQLDTLFDEYTRYNKELNRSREGIGLGMSITKRLLDLLHGDISVKSEVKIGSAFTVRIPQKKVDELVCGPEMSERLNSYRFLSTQIKKHGTVMREYMPYGNILIVDDVASNLYVAGGLLVPYGVKTETASGGYEAIDIIKSGKEYDIIFMDHMMPDIDGIETVKILRDMGYKGYIVALTANAIIGQADVFLSSGFDDYISKPIDSRELDRVLNTLIRDKKPAEVIEAARREKAAQSKKGKMQQKQAAWHEQSMQQDASDTLDDHFIYDAENAIATIKSISAPSGDIIEDQLNTYEVTIHGIKSSLHNIGEDFLSERAYKLERAAHEGNIEQLNEETPALIEALQAIVNEKKSK